MADILTPDSLNRFEKECQDMGITLTSEQLQQFEVFYSALIEKNRVMNLTAITEPDEVVTKHFLDSLSLVYACSLEKDHKVLDLGTGAGFPGLPLKIAYPDVTFVLADSLNKRVRFLQEVIEDLHLTQISAVHGRAEELARTKEHREQYDVVVSRAVANLSTLSEYCLPFVKVGGVFAAYKSGQVEDELNESKHAIHLLGGKCETVKAFSLDEQYERTLVVIRKETETKKCYPRKAGTPAKQPL